MSRIRSRCAVALSLFLSYLLLILLCTPFSVSGSSSLLVGRMIPVQQQALARYREGEILVRFRDGVSQRDKESIIATYGVRTRKPLQGETGFEKLENRVFSQTAT